MDEYADHPTPDAITAAQARAALLALMARLSDADAVALWHLIASWYPGRMEERTRHV
jgi:hypothetical protein